MEEKPNAKRNKGKGGRPRLDPADVRTRTIGVRVNASEMASLEHRAQVMGMSPAQWLRHAGLSRQLPPRPTPEINRRMYVELGKIGANLNQLARAQNFGIPAQQGTMLTTLLRIIREIRLNVLGVPEDAE